MSFEASITLIFSWLLYEYKLSFNFKKITYDNLLRWLYTSSYKIAHKITVYFAYIN